MGIKNISIFSFIFVLFLTPLLVQKPTAEGCWAWTVSRRNGWKTSLRCVRQQVEGRCLEQLGRSESPGKLGSLSGDSNLPQEIPICRNLVWAGQHRRAQKTKQCSVQRFHLPACTAQKEGNNLGIRAKGSLQHWLAPD